MKTTTTLCCVFFLALLCLLLQHPHTADAASDAGIQTSIGLTSITALANKIIPVVFEKIKSADIPTVRDGKNEINRINVEKLSLQSLSVTTNNSDRIILNISKFTAAASFHFKHHGKIVSYSIGCSATISDSNFGMHILLKKNASSKLIVEFQNVSFNAGGAGFKFHGSLAAKLLNAAKSLFNSKIKHAIISGVSGALKTTLYTLSGAMANGVELRAPVQNFGSMDLGVKSISYANNAITVGFSGDIQRTAGAASSTPRHDVAIGVPGANMFKMALDTFVFNSFFESYFKSQILTRTLTSANKGTMPATVPFVASGWSQHIPALATQYQNNALSFKFALKTAPLLSVTSGVAKFQAVTTMTMLVGTTPVAVFDLNMSSGATISITTKVVNAKTTYIITPQLQGVTFAFTNTQTILGPIDMAKVNGILNVISNGVVVPIFNLIMVGGIPMSPFLGNTGLVLKNPQLVFPTNGIVVAFTLDYQFPQ